MCLRYDRLVLANLLNPTTRIAGEGLSLIICVDGCDVELLVLRVEALELGMGRCCRYGWGV